MDDAIDFMDDDAETMVINICDRLPRGTIIQLTDGNQAIVESSSLNWANLEQGYMVQVSTGFFIRNFSFFIPDSMIVGVAEVVDPFFAGATD